VKIVAVDYGSARTGIAVSDPTGTLARPVGVIERAGTEGGRVGGGDDHDGQEPEREPARNHGAYGRVT